MWSVPCGPILFVALPLGGAVKYSRLTKRNGWTTPSRNSSGSVAVRFTAPTTAAGPGASALLGGGIRSATFALGLLKALAQRRQPLGLRPAVHRLWRRLHRPDAGPAVQPRAAQPTTCAGVALVRRSRPRCA